MLLSRVDHNDDDDSLAVNVVQWFMKISFLWPLSFILFILMK